MDELISKRAVIEAIEKARANVGHNLERSIGKSIIEILDEVGEDVGKLPSAQPDTYWKEQCQSYEQTINKLRESLSFAQPKRGKWIDRGEHESGGRYWHEWECNICHHYFDERTFFCPHCGCDMRGEQYG